MKKLMVMLGAVAMAFGLFADATNYKTSFEANEPGVGTGTYDPAAADWTGITEAMTLGAYAGDAYAYPVDEVAGNKRREDFSQFDAQDNFLTLDTGADSLDRAITKGEKDIFIDQLVKFTGFEDPQTNVVEGTKIAVWMSEFVIDDETEATETNLYVTVGSEYATDPVAVKIIGDYELGKWYRITIKSIGDVFGGNAETARSGFLVFIDGKPATIDTTVTGYVALISQTDKLSGAAAAAYDNDQLFPAITEGGEMLAGVGYKGVGAIDDVYIDELGPEFARFVDVAIADLTLEGTKVIKVGDTVIDGQTTIQVKPGVILVDYEANGPYVVKNGTGVKWTVSSDDLVMDPEAKITVTEAAVEITHEDKSVEYFDEDDTIDALKADQLPVVNGDTVKFLQDIDVWVEVAPETEVEVFKFTKNTEIAVAADDGISYWEVTVANDGDTKGELIYNANINANKDITVSFDDEEPGTFSFGGASIAGALTVNGEVTLPEEGVITLTGDGSLTTTTTLTKEMFTTDDTGMDVDVSVEGGTYTAKLVALPTTFTVTVAASNATLFTNDFAVVDNSFTAEAGTKFTLTAEAAADFKDAKIKINDVEVSEVTVNDDVTIVVTATAKEYYTEITLNKTELTLDPDDDPVQLVATTTPETAADDELVWTSSDEDVATVEDGLVEPHTEGEVTITVASKHNPSVKATCTVTVESKAAPSPVPPEQGTVEYSGSGESAVAKITPNPNVTTIDVTPTIGFMGKYEIPSSVTKITGVGISQLIIKTDGHDIAPACKLVNGGEIALDDTKTVGEVPVKPTIGSGVAATDVKPADGAIQVKGIAGLYYALVRGDDPATVGTAGTVKAAKMAVETGAAVSLSDDTTKGTKGFYVIKVSIEAPAIVE